MAQTPQSTATRPTRPPAGSTDDDHRGMSNALTMKRNTLLLSTVLATLLFGALFAVSPAAAQADGEINVTLDPEDATVGVGETQTYEVVVEDPDSGILAYDNLSISVDPGTAEIVDFRETHTSNFSLSEIQDSNSTLSLSAATEDDFENASQNYTLVEFDVEALAGGETGVTFDQSADATVTDYNDTAYNITTLSGATLSVDTPPTFEVSDLQPADATVQNGTTVDVSADIENTGSEAGTQDVTLSVGGVSATQTETLNASENTTVTFSNVDTGALGPGNYSHEIATANDSASGNLTVETGQAPASFEVANLDPTDATVQNGSTLDVSADIENTGGVAGTQDVTLSVGGVSATQTETLNASENTTVTFEVETGALGPGSYTHEIATDNDSATGTVNVSAAPEPPAVPAPPAPTDPDDDGLYEDVRGDGTFDIFDVQTMFSNLNAPGVKNNPEFFSFQTSSPGEVSIFDVQALFTEL